MGMSIDLKAAERTQLWADMMQLMTDGNAEGAGEKFREYLDQLEQSVNDQIRAVAADTDRAVLAQRGQRQLTAAERTYYETLIENLMRHDYQQAVTGINVTIPESVITDVFDNLTKNYPLLELVDARVYPGKVRIIYDESSQNKAVWGTLTATIMKQIAAELKETEAGAHKLSAFIYASKPMLELGAEWLDRYVRTHLYDALAYGLEDGIVNGTGINEPIGMIRNLSSYDTTTGYAAKAATALTSFSAENYGAILKDLAQTGAGKSRRVGTVIFLYNPKDWYTLVYPAVYNLTSNGYANIVPFDTRFVPCISVPEKKAIVGIAGQYLLTIATSKDGQIEFSDDYKFLEDNRTYLIKFYGNGMPKDNVSFKYLNITNLKPFVPKVQIDGTTPVQISGTPSVSISGTPTVTIDGIVSTQEVTPEGGGEGGGTGG